MVTVAQQHERAQRRRTAHQKVVQMGVSCCVLCHTLRNTCAKLGHPVFLAQSRPAAAKGGRQWRPPTSWDAICTKSKNSREAPRTLWPQSPTETTRQNDANICGEPCGAGTPTCCQRGCRTAQLSPQRTESPCSQPGWYTGAHSMTPNSQNAHQPTDNGAAAQRALTTSCRVQLHEILRIYLKR